MMNVSSTIVPLSSLVLGLSLVACVPPTPKADPPRTLKPVGYGTLSVANIGNASYSTNAA
jgi:hypothetical protein